MNVMTVAVCVRIIVVMMTTRRMIRRRRERMTVARFT